MLSSYIFTLLSKYYFFFQHTELSEFRLFILLFHHSFMVACDWIQIKDIFRVLFKISYRYLVKRLVITVEINSFHLPSFYLLHKNVSISAKKKIIVKNYFYIYSIKWTSYCYEKYEISFIFSFVFQSTNYYIKLKMPKVFCYFHGS